MTRILLINPNTSQATTELMVAIAQSAVSDYVGADDARSDHVGSDDVSSDQVGSHHAGSGHVGSNHAEAGCTRVIGATARHGAAMIVDAATLAAAAEEVVELGLRFGRDVSGIIVSAFGDPGLVCLRRKVAVPVVGIAEAAMREAAGNARRFGIATVTPDLVGPIDDRAAALGLGHLYTGIRLTSGDPAALAADPDRLVRALADAVRRCIRDDKAEAVVIGGGPLGDAATVLASCFAVPVIAPIPAAVRRLMALLGNRS
jgi:allantoin racemase